MWSKDSLPPGQENFVINLIRQKLLTAIDSLPPAIEEKDSWLLFLPEDEFHETGLLLAHYLIRQSGKKVIYLGANIPTQTIISAIHDVSPVNLLFFQVCKKPGQKDFEFIETLNQHFPQKKLFLSCDPNRLTEIKKGLHFHPLHTVEELERVLA